MPGEIHIPTDAEMEAANLFCHAFIRMMIAENIEPRASPMYIGAVMAQVVQNIADQFDMTTEDALAGLVHNARFFLNCLSPGKATKYEYPNPARNKR